ncbi:MAG: hypothetical protein M3011_11635 [Actinomycetota bacterium]|nr:hypothetical protein [Actinomycetota bacterium]
MPTSEQGPEPDDGPDGADQHDSGHDVVVHLQAAALEVIAAVRALLDAAEGAVRDPLAAVTLASSLAARARHGHDGDDDGPEGSGGVEHIPVS